MRISLRIVIAFVALSISTRIWAQPAVQPTTSAASLTLSEGVVYMNDKAVEATAVPLVLPDDAIVRTSEGRAAVALKRGGWLFLNADSSVRVVANGVYNFNRIEVLTGSAIVASGTSAPLVDCESDIRLSDAGLFRFDVQPISSTGERSCRLRVFEGAAAIPLVSVTAVLRAGQTMMCNRRCGDMVQTNKFAREQLDDFDRWVRQMEQRLKD